MSDVTPTARELEALKVLWRLRRDTVREIYGELETKDGELAYTTALSLLQTMEQKGLVGHESAGKAVRLLRQGQARQCVPQASGRLPGPGVRRRDGRIRGPCPPVAPAYLGRAG